VAEGSNGSTTNPTGDAIDDKAARQRRWSGGNRETGRRAVGHV